MNGVDAWHLTRQRRLPELRRSRRARARGQRAGARRRPTTAPRSPATLRLMDIDIRPVHGDEQRPGYPQALRGVLLPPRRLRRSSRRRTAGAVRRRRPAATSTRSTSRAAARPAASATGGNICEELRRAELLRRPRRPAAGGPDAPPRDGTSPGTPCRCTSCRDDVAGAPPARAGAGRGCGSWPSGCSAATGSTSRSPTRRPGALPPAEPGGDGQVIWVWPEMAYGFLHGIEALGRRAGPATGAPTTPQPDWKIVHFFGYDNSFYHAILYPALYRLAYPGLDTGHRLQRQRVLPARRQQVLHQPPPRDLGQGVARPAQRRRGAVLSCRCTRPEGRRTNFERQDVRRPTVQRRADRHLAALAERPRLAGREALRRHGPGRRDLDPGAHRLPRPARRPARRGDRQPRPGRVLAQPGRRRAGTASSRTSPRSRARERPGGARGWRDEARTAIALELAAARLLAHCGAPVMPRFAGRLAAALGAARGRSAAWPRSATLVTLAVAHRPGRARSSSGRAA